MVVLVATGDRRWKNKALIHKTLAPFPKGSWIIEGGAGGADRLSREVGFELGFQPIVAYANWGVYDRLAGPMRNQVIGELLSVLKNAGYDIRAFAFHNDIRHSKATKDMLAIFEGLGIPCPIIKEESPSPPERTK